MTSQTTDEAKVIKEMAEMEGSINDKQLTREELIEELSVMTAKHPDTKDLAIRIALSLEGRTELERDELLNDLKNGIDNNSTLAYRVRSALAGPPLSHEEIEALHSELVTVINHNQELRSLLKDPFRIKILKRLHAGSLLLIMYQTRCPFTGRYGDKQVRLTFGNQVVLDAGEHSLSLALNMFKDIKGSQEDS